MTKIEAERNFKESHGDCLIKTYQRYDKPALREAWNNFTDHLCKSGEITVRQYETWHHPKFIKITYKAYYV